MNILEKVVRDLLSEKRISEARNLLSIFPGEYPHLELEVEYAARNWKAVKKLYESLPDELKERYSEYYKHASEQYNIDYSREAEEALKEIERRNLQGAISIIESIVKDYPELVEVIALRYKLAKQRNDKKAAERYRKILMNLDRTHPVLMEKDLSTRKIGIFEILIVFLLVTVLFVSIFAIFAIPPRVASNIELPVSNQKVDIRPVEQRVEDVLANIAILTENVGKLNDVLQDQISSLKKNADSFSNELEAIKEALNDLNLRLSGIESTIVSLMKGKTTSVVYVPLQKNRIERAKSLWFLGYMFYLRREYDEAIKRFDIAIEEIGEEDVYFKDDVYYYRALCYYFKGDLSKARSLFERFVEEFPNSEYTDDAEYFLRKIK
ncbi:tol-pal system YbgF family protein [Thermotoga sp. KOL6]|uniref:tetratricopeptide repeat protein n=1 Tax=Thermotoga sp. KOL6 TaxID=126741 RepID=UPI000C75C1F5|nr:tetratricopeptide repeat protein [Thermotoga sp. KOL6]PLV59727.1 hypothetical protein AS005_00025 [Thermotoga sp. KOL6]